MSQAAVRHEQIRTLYRQSVPVLVANLVNAALVCAALWGGANRRALVLFVAAMATMTVVRIDLHRRFRSARPGPSEVAPWARRFVAGSVCAGLIWGTAAAVFFDVHSPLSQILLTFVIGGMGAGAAGTLACYLPAFVGYLVPSIVPLTVRALLVGDPLHLSMGAMMTVYAVALSGVAYITNRALTEAFRLRFENVALVSRLSASQQALEQTNQTLEQRVQERSTALERQGEVLRHALRLESIGRLAGGIAHNFNNLLTVVLAHVALLFRDGSLDRAGEATLSEIEKASRRGAELVRQLMAFSRRQRLDPRLVDLNQVLTAMQRLLSPVIGEHVTIDVKLAHLPALVRIDPGEIEQAIVNLATNARDAMAGQGTLTMGLTLLEAEGDRALPRGAYVVLSVADTGVGMDAETQSRIFEPFFTTKELGQGTGLGLAMVYGLVEQSHGHIAVRSELGAGTELRIYLPRAHEGDVEARPAAISREAASGPTLLPLDDDLDPVVPTGGWRDRSSRS